MPEQHPHPLSAEQLAHDLPARALADRLVAPAAGRWADPFVTQKVPSRALRNPGAGRPACQPAETV
jgi:hypothetical protein